MPDPEMAIGELSRRTGCNIETVRYYERIGLIPAARRHGRYRRYNGVDVGRLEFIRRARDLGFTLQEVRALLGLAATQSPACAESRNLAAAHLADVRARIADLRRMERTLVDTVRRCDSGDEQHCPLIEALTRRADRRGAPLRPGKRSPR